jgi:hypothetical protein
MLHLSGQRLRILCIITVKGAGVMNRLKIFDRALLGKQIGGIGLIVILDVICLIFSPFYGRMSFIGVSSIFLVTNILGTCFLYHSFLIVRGDMRFELNTEKIVYYPTTRAQFLMNKYAKTLIYLVVQLMLTNICLWLGSFTAHGEMDRSRYLGCNLLVFISILCTSGVILLVMHLMPMGIYFSLISYYPLSLLAKGMKLVHQQSGWFDYGETSLSLICAIFTFVLWLLLLWLGVKIYERVD